jgi:hypothetical protein
MVGNPFLPPWWLQNGIAMTVYSALVCPRNWEQHTAQPEPDFREVVFAGAGGVPIFGQVAIPPSPHGTVVATYGITGSLDNQWFLQILRRKAYARGYAVVLFDWRAHGKTAELSPTLTSDGLYEGEDFVRIAATAKAMGCPAPFWFAGYSLGGQLALWGVKAAQSADSLELGLPAEEIGGAATICPNLDSQRSLTSLVLSTIGRQTEKAISNELRRLAWRIHDAHPGAIDPAAIERAEGIWGFDRELVIGPLGFPSVEAYYQASSPIHILPHLAKPTLILYAADDPMFHPDLVPELEAIGRQNSSLHLQLTQYGGHVAYLSNPACQKRWGDGDRWWAWNRVLDWFDRRSA